MKLRLGSLMAVTALLMAACGGGEPADTSAGGGEGGNEMTLTIESPEAGAEVSVPFTIQLASSVPLGAPDTGEHHVHIYFDDNEEDYAVVEGDSYEVTELPPGAHEIHASLRNADHSTAGVEVEAEVEVAGTDTGGGSEKEDKDGGGGYDY